MKYVIFGPADQTILYIAKQDGDDFREATETTVCAMAAIFDTLPDALDALCQLTIRSVLAMKDPKATHGPHTDEQIYTHAPYYIEEIPDVAEFKSRPDTW